MYRAPIVHVPKYRIEDVRADDTRGADVRTTREEEGTLGGNGV